MIGDYHVRFSEKGPSLSLSPLTTHVDFGLTEEARQRSIFNKLELHMGSEIPYFFSFPSQ
jgi:hypothetical protein